MGARAGRPVGSVEGGEHLSAQLRREDEHELRREWLAWFERRDVHGSSPQFAVLAVIPPALFVGRKTGLTIHLTKNKTRPRTTGPGS